MTTALAPASNLAALGLVAPSAEQDTKALAGAVSSMKKFPPYIRLFGSSSDLVKEGKFPMGNFGLTYGSDAPVPFGTEFDCLILAWRPKAMQIEPLTVIYDVAHPEYQRIKQKVETAPPNTYAGAFFGPEFLLWLPSIGELAHYHFANPTHQKESPNLVKNLMVPVSLKSKLIKRGKNSWHGPKLFASETPIDLPPASEEIVLNIARFNERKNTIPEASTRQDTGRAR